MTIIVNPDDREYRQTVERVVMVDYHEGLLYLFVARVGWLPVYQTDRWEAR